MEVDKTTCRKKIQECQELPFTLCLCKYIVSTEGNKIYLTPNQIDNMNLKIIEIQSKFKKPTLKRVKISAEAMLSVLLGGKHKESFDFKANLKTVKKEEEKVSLATVLASPKHSGYSHYREMNCFVSSMLCFQQKEEVTDWRKNVEAMSGMEGRKKLFDASGN